MSRDEKFFEDMDLPNFKNFKWWEWILWFMLAMAAIYGGYTLVKSFLALF